MKTILGFASLLALASHCQAFSTLGRVQKRASPFMARKKGADPKPTNDDGVDPSKKAALDAVFQQIERSYGRGSIVKLGDAENMIVDCVGSGSLTLGKLTLLHTKVWVLVVLTLLFG